MNVATGDNFDKGMHAWQAYQEAPWGKLRYRIGRANLQPHLPQPPARVLDLGGGNGFDAVPLAQDGFSVSVLDFSAEMVAQGQRFAEAKGVSDRVTFIVEDATQLADRISEPTFDVVLCHNVLQYVEDGTAVFTSIFNALKPNGILSLIITNPYAETLAAALRDYDMQVALDYLDQQEKYVEMFDTIIQRHTDTELMAMLTSANFVVEAQYGIRCICDFIADNERKFDPDFYTQLEVLEMAVRDKRPYISLARFYHFIALKKESYRD
jgi:S-adenosylmethionine-dependent methyltransferase